MSLVPPALVLGILPHMHFSAFLGRLARFLKRQEKPVSGWCCTPMSFRPSWSIVWVSGQPGLQEPLVEHLFLKIALIWGAKILAWYQLGISTFSYPFVAVRKIVSPTQMSADIFQGEEKKERFFCLFVFVFPVAKQEARVTSVISGWLVLGLKLTFFTQNTETTCCFPSSGTKVTCHRCPSLCFYFYNICRFFKKWSSKITRMMPWGKSLMQTWIL